MERHAFAPSAPGKLVAITTRTGKDWAFVPDELPPEWKLGSSLWPRLVEAREALGTLNGIGQTLPDPQLLMRPLLNREALTSSMIEGTFVTPEQLLLYELDPKEPSTPNERAADWLEVHNYGTALRQGCELLERLPLCNRVIKAMHAALMEGVRGRDKAPGEFRTAQVQIGSTARFMPPPATEVDRLMGNLEVYINTEHGDLDPLVRCFLVHYQFEAIHPFLDGNGRIGRALLSLMTYTWLGHSAPWLYMSAFYERYKEEYVEKLFKVSTLGAWNDWIEFCLVGATEQAKDAVRRCNEFHRLKKEFHERVQAHGPTSRTHDLIESLFDDPVIRIPRLAEKLGVSYPTAKADVDVLIRAGILSQLPNRHPKAFYCPEVFHTAYSEEVS